MPLTVTKGPGDVEAVLPVPVVDETRVPALRSKSWAWVTAPVLTRRFNVFGLVPVPLVISAVAMLDVVMLELGVLVVLVLELVELVLMLMLVLVALAVADDGGIDRKLVPSGPANCGVPKMNVLGLGAVVLEPVDALAAGVVRVITPDEAETPDGVGTSIGVSTLATGVVTARMVVVDGVVVIGVAICATLTPEAVESATAAIVAQVISDKSLVSFMAGLPDFGAIKKTRFRLSSIQILHNGCGASTCGT